MGILEKQNIPQLICRILILNNIIESATHILF